MFLALTVFVFEAQAEKFQLVKKTDGYGLTMDIPYVAGTHRGSALEAAGLIDISQDLKIVLGKFSLPISSLKTGNSTRDCHMREALGLNYAVSSFPNKHVCNPQNEIPKTGNDAVVYENIDFELTGIEVEGDRSNLLTPGNTFILQAMGQWIIHGKNYLMNIPLKVTVLQDRLLSVKGSFNLSLKQFEIIVKPVLGMGVGDNVKVGLDVLLAPEK